MNWGNQLDSFKSLRVLLDFGFDCYGFFSEILERLRTLFAKSATTDCLTTRSLLLKCYNIRSE